MRYEKSNVSKCVWLLSLFINTNQELPNKHNVKDILLQIALHLGVWGQRRTSGRVSGWGRKPSALGLLLTQIKRPQQPPLLPIHNFCFHRILFLFFVHSAIATFPFPLSDEWQAQKLSPPDANWVREQSVSATSVSSSSLRQRTGDTCSRNQVHFSS